MTIRDELILVKGNKEILHPSDVVEWARRRPESKLHSAFEWDDAKAGEQYRVWQARQFIAMHIVTEKGEREMVSLSIDRVKGGYRDIEDVIAVPELKEVMLQDALNELERIRAKYGRLRKLAGIWREVDKASELASRGLAKARKEGQNRSEQRTAQRA